MLSRPCGFLGCEPSECTIGSGRVYPYRYSERSDVYCARARSFGRLAGVIRDEGARREDSGNDQFEPFDFMKNVRTALSARYLAALRRHLDRKATRRGNPAHNFGRAIVDGGMVTRDLVLMHEAAMMTLALSRDDVRDQSGARKRAGFFFTEALVPLEADQRATRELNLHLQQRNETLCRQGEVLSRGNERLQNQVLRCKAAEAAFRKGEEEHRALFLDSQIMQRKLRRL